MRDVDLDGDNLCPHDKYFEGCDDCIDDKYCHYENDDVSGCGVLIYETLRDEFYPDDYCEGSYFFIGTKSFKFCPMCGKEASFYWQKPSHIAWQFEQELKEKEKKRIKKEKDRLKKEEIERLDREILELKNLRKEIKVSDFK
jgi:hypothetical protein